MLEMQMDVFDLKGFLFVHFPLHLTFEEAMEQLEYEIEETADEYRAEVPAEDIAAECDSTPAPAFSPYWLNLVLERRAHDEIAKLSPAERRRELDKIWIEREKRTKAGKPHPTDPTPLDAAASSPAGQATNTTKAA